MKNFCTQKVWINIKSDSWVTSLPEPYSLLFSPLFASSLLDSPSEVQCIQVQIHWANVNSRQPQTSQYTVAKNAWFCLIFAGNSWFWYNWVRRIKMCLNCAKIVSIPRVSIHKWPFEPKLTSIVKKIVLKIFRQNLKICLFWCMKMTIFSNFAQRFWGLIFLFIPVNLGSNDLLLKETLGIESIFAILKHILSQCINYTKIRHFPRIWYKIKHFWLLWVG